MIPGCVAVSHWGLGESLVQVLLVAVAVTGVLRVHGSASTRFGESRPDMALIPELIRHRKRRHS